MLVLFSRDKTPVENFVRFLMHVVLQTTLYVQFY